jgi:hypothetical protein
MHEAYARSPVAPVWPPAEGPVAAVVAEPPAAPDVDGPPPQAATATPTARIPAALIAARCRRGRRLAWSSVGPAAGRGQGGRDQGLMFIWFLLAPGRLTADS